MNTSTQQILLSIELAQQTGDALQRYIAIHNRLFASPIKKLFKAIFKDSVDYEALVDKLQIIMTDLNGIRRLIDDPSMLGETLIRYVDALTDTVVTLRDLCAELNKKNKGTNSSYTLLDYQSDHACYQNCVNTYRAIGGQLNEQIRSIQSGSLTAL